MQSNFEIDAIIINVSIKWSLTHLIRVSQVDSKIFPTISRHVARELYRFASIVICYHASSQFFISLAWN